MEQKQRQLLAAAALVFAVVCSEKPAEKKKRRHRRVWTQPRLRERGQQGVSVLQKELEGNDRTGFKELLRMTAEEFDFLLERVAPLITKENTKFRKAISARERLSVTLRFLATGESFQSLGFQYRIGGTTVSQIVLSTCEALYEVMKKDYLKTPTCEADWRAIAKDFCEKWQYPNCLGALDAKRIHIQPPGHSGKSRVSVVLMAVVDANYRFVYVDVSSQGRLSDSDLFAHSNLCRAIDGGLLNVPTPEPLPNSNTVMPHIFVGGDAFPVRLDLQKPYSHRELDHDQRIYNYRLSRAWRVAENAFGILANRLRVFRTTICLDPDKVVKITLASCVIHNYLRERRSEAYTPPSLADWEGADHEMVPGVWRRDGQGAFQNVAACRARNPTQGSEELRDIMKDYFVSPQGQVPWQESHI